MKTFSRKALFPAIIILVASCDKLPMNGDLDGMWQMVSEQRGDTLTDRLDDRIYVSYQLHTVQMGTGSASGKFYAQFTHIGDTISYANICYGADSRSETDVNEPVDEDEMDVLQPWGIYSLQPTYHVDRLTKETLILTSDTSTLRFRKF